MENYSGLVHVQPVLLSYASISGYSGYVVDLGPVIPHGQWSLAGSKLRRTVKPVYVYVVLKSFSKKLPGHTVKQLMNNHDAMCMHSGSK